MSEPASVSEKTNLTSAREATTFGAPVHLWHGRSADGSPCFFLDVWRNLRMKVTDKKKNATNALSLAPQDEMKLWVLGQWNRNETDAKVRTRSTDGSSISTEVCMCVHPHAGDEWTDIQNVFKLQILRCAVGFAGRWSSCVVFFVCFFLRLWEPSYASHCLKYHLIITSSLSDLAWFWVSNSYFLHLPQSHNWWNSCPEGGDSGSWRKTNP